jgi:GNAT superfamily N-acetyltransferase
MRRAEASDLDRVVTLAANFHAYGVWKDVPLDRGAFTAFVANLIENGAVFLTDTGVIAGLISPFYFQPAFKLGVELFWWAPDGGGRELREAFEGWAREQGATAVQFSAMGDENAERVARLYRRAGFEPAETAFVKRF